MKRESKSSITKVIRQEFTKEKRQIINDLCAAVKANSSIDPDKIDVNHRVSSLYSLHKHGEI